MGVAVEDMEPELLECSLQPLISLLTLLSSETCSAGLEFEVGIDSATFSELDVFDTVFLM